MDIGEWGLVDMAVEVVASIAESELAVDTEDLSDHSAGALVIANTDGLEHPLEVLDVRSRSGRVLHTGSCP